MADALIEKPKEAVAGITVHTIPMEFYGGKNPTPPEIPVTAPVRTEPLKPKLPPQIVIPTKQQTTQTQTLKKTSNVKYFVIGGIVLIVGVGVAVAWWFLRLPTPAAQTQQQIALSVVPPSPVATTTVPEVATTSTTTTQEIVVATTTPVNLIPPHTYIDSADSDADGVTDNEEEIWNTNPASSDTDGDLYSDQLELLNLYNPIGTAPQKLIDSKLVSLYTNPATKYIVLYPTAWIARPLDETAPNEVLFSSPTGEYIEIRTFDYPKEPFPDWFAEQFQSENLAQYEPFKNRYGVIGVMSADNMVAIISDGASIYLMTYHGDNRQEINYRTSFRVMVQSFKPASAVAVAEIMPEAIATTTTETITSTQAESATSTEQSTTSTP